MIAAEQGREDVAVARAEWLDAMMTLDPTKLVFIDESGFNTKMTRLRGRSARGTPCVGSVPYGHWQNNTFIAELRNDRIVAPLLIPGPIDGDAFVVWVERALAPTLSKGDIVICDNLNVHKNARARAAIEACGAEMRFLPAYSPDLNPIEMLFAKIKSIARSAAGRCFDTICDAIAKALNDVPETECSNYLRHAGYDPT